VILASRERQINAAAFRGQRVSPNPMVQFPVLLHDIGFGNCQHSLQNEQDDK